MNKQQKKKDLHASAIPTDHMWQDIKGPSKALMLMSHSSLCAVKYHTAQRVTRHGAPTTDEPQGKALIMLQPVWQRRNAYPLRKS